MSDEVKKWFNLAENDFKSAKKNFKMKIYYISAFLCQQSIEKGLKALYIKKYNKLWKIHDLIELAKKVDANSEIIDVCAKLNSTSIETRYPDVPVSYAKKRDHRIIKQC